MTNSSEIKISPLNFHEYTVLIVDDNPINLGVVSDYLEDYGFEIMVAQDGESGLTKAIKGQPDLILLDVVMPGIDGFETCCRLKAHQATQEIPIIFMTALTSTEDKVKGFEVGAVDYITKPIQQEEVMARATTHLRIRDLARQLKEQNQHLEKKAIQLETISQVGRQIISILDLRELLEKIVAFIQTKFDYYFVGIWLLDEAQDSGRTEDRLVLQVGVKRGETPQYEPGLVIPINLSHHIIVSVCRTRQYYMLDETKTETEFFTSEKLPSTRVELALPLQMGQRIIGVLDIHSDQATTFEREDITVFQSLADEIAIAIRNARLYELEKNFRQIEEERSRRLAELNMSKDKFFSIVAHDLKGPFQPLLLMAEFLFKDAETLQPKDVKEMSDSICRSAKNIYNLLENLLEWARMQIEGIEYQPAKLNLQAIVKQNIQLFAQNGDKKGVKVQNKVPNNLFVYADKNMLNTILGNLISNGVKFTSGGGTVTISAQVGSSRELWGDIFAEIAVSDTGVGISKRDQEKLFQMQSHHSTVGTAKEQGTGLGLIICKEMVEKNGGQIWVESELDKGTVVKFTVPNQDMGKKK